MPGRHTGNARHLNDPAKKIYYGIMEEGFYEVDVSTLAVKALYVDGNVKGNGEKQPNHYNNLLLGAHGKGYYSGQVVTVYFNNGEAGELAEKQFDVESGSLSEWDGKNWKVVRRNQFVDVTGPDGIWIQKPNFRSDLGYGLGPQIRFTRCAGWGKWAFFRLPKPVIAMTAPTAGTQNGHEFAILARSTNQSFS